jgi:hypothetical protein
VYIDDEQDNKHGEIDDKCSNKWNSDGVDEINNKRGGKFSFITTFTYLINLYHDVYIDNEINDERGGIFFFFMSTTYAYMYIDDETNDKGGERGGIFFFFMSTT